MSKPLCKWQRPVEKPYGIICGTDKTQEWLLPWWWSCYRKHNGFPVTFCDFGMSPAMRQWCLERGEVVDIEWDSQWVAAPEALSQETLQWCELCSKDVWARRSQWFKKPLACLTSAYEVGLWLDLDCEVRGSLSPLFTEFSSGVDLALVDICSRGSTSCLIESSGGTGYNGGVVVFRHRSPIVQAWAQTGIEMNQQFPADDHILSYLIYLHTLPLQQWPQRYNWVDVGKAPADAVIVHWIHRQKEALRPLCEELYVQALM
jgi:hypothetical protein